MQLRCWRKYLAIIQSIKSDFVQFVHNMGCNLKIVGYAYGQHIVLSMKNGNRPNRDYHQLIKINTTNNK